MILYYTYGQKTKVFAESLSEVLNLRSYELKADINNKSKFGFMFSALKLAFTNKSSPVSNIPDNLPEEIFVCGPIWGGTVAAPIKYFFENANLERTKVYLLLTASIPTEKYRQTAKEYLRKFCIPGDVHLFATNSKIMPEKEILIEQLHKILELE